MSSQVPESGRRFIQGNAARNAESLNSKKGSDWQVKGPGRKQKQQVSGLIQQDSSKHTSSLKYSITGHLEGFAFVFSFRFLVRESQCVPQTGFKCTLFLPKPGEC